MTPGNEPQGSVTGGAHLEEKPPGSGAQPRDPPCQCRGQGRTIYAVITAPGTIMGGSGGGGGKQSRRLRSHL